MSSAVQFYGAEQVLKAFRYKKMPTWALFQGTSLIHKCETDDLSVSEVELSEFLEMINNGTTAIYRLKVYEGGKVNERTPCDGSFNFRLTEDDRDSHYSGNRAMDERLGRIEKMLLEDEDEPEPKGMLGQIGDVFLNDPAKVPMMIAALRSVLEIVVPGMRQQPPPQSQQLQPAPVYYSPPVPANQYAYGAAINGIPEPERPAPSPINDVKSSIAILERNDAKLHEHLHKLATMSEKDKPGFTYLLSLLDALPA